MIRQGAHHRNNCHDSFERFARILSKAMALIVLLLFAFMLASRVKGFDVKYSGQYFTPELEISHDSGVGVEKLVKKQNESLTLTCRVVWRPSAAKQMPKFQILWTRSNGVHDGLKTTPSGPNSVLLHFNHLNQDDNGEYKCEARDISKGNKANRANLLSSSVQVFVVMVKNKTCSSGLFACPRSIGPTCIADHYVCDGKPDCIDGEDESDIYANCDPLNPCKNKIMCEDGRCKPQSWCCNTSHPGCNVTHQPPCCKYWKSTLSTPSPDQFAKGIFEVSESQSLHHMGFLQTTIYTVIGCAMAFMFIVTIIVIAICRVHMKRTLLSGPGVGAGVPVGLGAGRPPPGGNQQGLLYDLDLYLSHHSGLLVTYNIRNGVHFVGRPVDPPPYCEVVTSPPREGPPPPYVSHENLASRNLTLEEDGEEQPARESDALLSRTPLEPPESQSLHQDGTETSSSSTQTGNPETVPVTRSLLSAPPTMDTATQVTHVSDLHQFPSVSVLGTDRPEAGQLRTSTVGRLRESFIGLRERYKEEPVIEKDKQSCTVEPVTSRSESKDRSEN